MLSLSSSSVEAAAGALHDGTALHNFSAPDDVRSLYIGWKSRVFDRTHLRIRRHAAKVLASAGDINWSQQNELKCLPSSQVSPHDDRKNEDFVSRSNGSDGLVQADVDVLQNQKLDGNYNLWTDDDVQLLASVIHKLEGLRLQALAHEQWNSSKLVYAHSKYQRGARNLVHFMALHSLDLQEVQMSLTLLGLANLHGIKSNVLEGLARVIDAARALSMVHSAGRQVKDAEQEVTCPSGSKSLCEQGRDNKYLQTGKTLARTTSELHENTVSLFGPMSAGRQTYIMVTLSEDAAENESTVLDLIKSGMNLVRINCAHGSPEVWGKIIRTVKHCSQMLEQPCRVLMDLAGPKIRTSPFPPGRRVRKIKPCRCEYGKLTTPARVWIASPGTPVPNGMSADAVVPVEGEKWLGNLQIGDQLKFKDIRGKLRQLTITEKIMGAAGLGCWAECSKTAYLESGTELKLSVKRGRHDKGYVGQLPFMEQFIRVQRGDQIILTKETFGQYSNDSSDNRVHRVQVSQTFGQLFDSVRPGELVRFDDGKIEGVIRCVSPLEITVEVTSAKDKGTKLGGQRSINLPENKFYQKGLTVKDLVDLDFIVGHADMVGLSFVNSAEDVQILQQALEKRKAMDIGVVLKIETKSGIEGLPDILLQGMKKKNPMGVMIARGDLAVECGWESLAFLQEELLSICRAANIPSIWATQVLEGLTKEGLATRPEITDAAAGNRASCILLNKGSYIVKAVSVLDSILSRYSVPETIL